MSKAVPWSVKGVGFDVREAAQEAARREGMSLSEWLSEAISAHATQAGVDFDHLDDDERLAAITERLHELDDQGRAADFRHGGGRRRPSEDRDAQGFDARRREPVSDRMTAASAPVRSLDADFLLEKAAERFQRQTAKNQRQTADALASVARLMQANESRREDERATLVNFSRRLGEIETNLSRRTSEEGADALKAALGRLEMRLDGMMRRPEPAVRSAPQRALPAAEPLAAGDAERLDRLETKLNSVLAAVTAERADAPAPSRAELRSAASPRSLGEAIAQIARRQRDLDASASPSGRAEMPAEGAFDKPASQADIRALASKIDDIRRDVLTQPARPAAAFDLDKLHAEIAQMSTALHDLAAQGSVAALEASIRRLTKEIEISRRDGANETVLQPLERVVGELRRSLAEIDPRTTITGLENQIKALGSKLDDLGRPELDPDAFQQVQQQTQEIRDLLTAAAARPAPVEKIEQQVAQIARRLDRQQHIAAVIEGGQATGTLLVDPAQTAALEKIEEQLGAVAARVEEVFRDTREARRHSQTQALEELVRGLADKIESARAPDSDTHAFEALERQIGELATRLDRSSTGLSTLPYLQQAIGDLFVKLEATQQVTVEAAETAARRAAQESLREAVAQGAFDNRPPLTGYAPGEVSREISDLRDLQDAADRRTHSTLNAVHETLEKVVDRLAMLEEELGEMRPEHTTPASSPAPNFSAGRSEPAAGSLFADVRKPASSDEPLVDERPARSQRKDDFEDFLIEPGRGFPGRGEADQAGATDKRRKTDRRASPADSPVTDRADFIAAARRAAHAAQMESAAAAVQARPAAAMESKEDTRQSVLAQARHFIAQHKRPVVLSVAAVFLLVGAYAVVKSLIHPPPADISLETPKSESQKSESQNHAQSDAPNSRPDIAQAAAKVQGPTQPSDPTKSQTIPGSDPIVVGSITPRPQEPAPAASESTHDMSQAAVQIQADLGNAKAQFELATRYMEGRGLGRDAKLAAQWYEKSAAQGLAAAQYRLGSFYEKGLGVTRDLSQAKSWYQKAAEQGNVRAMHNLAVLLAEVGESGQPDYARAAQWFRKAAEFGVRDSQYNYAILLARGLGVAQNLASSYTWLAIAAAQGDQDAAKKRDDVAARLSADELAAAKAVAEGFHARTPDPATNDVQWPGSAAIQPPAAKPQKPKVSQL